MSLILASLREHKVRVRTASAATARWSSESASWQVTASSQLSNGLKPRGVLSLTDFLVANGIDTSGWDSLLTASAISRNGQVIVGLGKYQGCDTSFIVDLGTACPADLDGSGDVGGGDLALLLNALGPCSGG